MPKEKQGCYKIVEMTAQHVFAALGLTLSREFADVDPVGDTDPLANALQEFSRSLDLVPGNDHSTLDNVTISASWLLLALHAYAHNAPIPESDSKFANAVKNFEDLFHSSLPIELGAGVIDTATIAGVFSLPFTLKMLPELINDSDTHPIAANAFLLLFAAGSIGLIVDAVRLGAIAYAKRSPITKLASKQPVDNGEPSLEAQINVQQTHTPRRQPEPVQDEASQAKIAITSSKSNVPKEVAESYVKNMNAQRDLELAEEIERNSLPFKQLKKILNERYEQAHLLAKEEHGVESVTDDFPTQPKKTSQDSINISVMRLEEVFRGNPRR